MPLPPHRKTRTDFESVDLNELQDRLVALLGDKEIEIHRMSEVLGKPIAAKVPFWGSPQDFDGASFPDMIGVCMARTESCKRAIVEVARFMQAVIAERDTH